MVAVGGSGGVPTATSTPSTVPTSVGAVTGGTGGKPTATSTPSISPVSAGSVVVVVSAGSVSVTGAASTDSS